MKLVTYSTNGGAPQVGILEDGRINPVGGPGSTMLEYIEHGRSAERVPGGEAVAVEAARLHAPVLNPQKIIGIGLNYSDHAAETGADIPEKPIVFAKYANSLVGQGDAIKIPSITQKADYEVELAVVIGRAAKGVSEAEALDYVFGYTNCNDISSRDLQFSEGGQWTRSKSIDTFCPLGPYIATADEVADPQALSLRCILNGEVMQDGTTSKMIFSVAELISFLSQGMTLLPGDIITTGTPPGVGAARDPQVFLKPGDEVTVEVEGLGSLTNPVEAG
ncbi:MAG: 5-carboxymethyl-2-hydroxymuconate delta-isomerase [uncultured Rubrobacteraceae bacterium]|uniref:5-carboxymethyl-2-hydroxymuconate delta-isomerase n=1 Tax=uncultured Rubrobacteraceae bacterium TaxID=349277 RepID=A0A6J4R4H0_9ACTN|nr:MAG: 5-carboxymethyl-2-hydroxymuconate delta-isomerase [uncultured Rubrobacteraceae bacterium]